MTSCCNTCSVFSANRPWQRPKLMKSRRRLLFAAAAFVSLLSASSMAAEGDLIFAVIGDYGSHRRAEGEVAALVKSWSPAFIITLGDNNYESGTAATIDLNIGQYYHEFIFPYHGRYGNGSSDQRNRFFPSLGNHDWRTDGAKPYLDYFTLPGNERYYDFIQGDLHFFALDSDSKEPDGTRYTSVQGQWFQRQIAASTSRYKIVYFHHPPYSSGRHGSTPEMQWPFEKLGVSIVLAGHDHDYERLRVRGVDYIVNGVGGEKMYGFDKVLRESIVRHNRYHGALKISYRLGTLLCEFFSTTGERLDSLRLNP